MDFKSRLQNLSKKQKAYIGALAVIVGVLVWAFISAGVITHNFNRSQLQTDQDRQEALMQGIILTETKDEKKYWEIYGETGNYDSKNGVAMLNNVIGNFYDDKNEVSMSFESSRGTYNEKKGQIILYDDTFIVLKDFTTLRANRLEWSGTDKPVIAEGISELRDKDFLATAKKLKSVLIMTTLRLLEMLFQKFTITRRKSEEDFYSFNDNFINFRACSSSL
ncbi:MAG: LPS export ABC transporter periplasmic protein LptC [Candidatus Gastranaerophilaceae bacterium]